MGNTGKARTPKKKKAAKENARAPRGRWANTKERAELDKAKSRGRMAAPALIEMLLGIAKDPTEEASDRISAAKTVMDRCGMPVVSSTDLTLDAGDVPVTLIRLGKGKDDSGWPDPVPAAGSD